MVPLSHLDLAIHVAKGFPFVYAVVVNSISHIQWSDTVSLSKGTALTCIADASHGTEQA